MAWTAQLLSDDDAARPDVGEAIATFTELNGTVFPYRRRGNFNGAEMTKFVTEANAALEVWRTSQASLETKRAALEAALNA